MYNKKTLTGRIASHPGFAVLCTLAGVTLTSFFSWLGVHQSAIISEKSSCISRIDTNERILREHSAEFISSIGDLIIRYFLHQTDQKIYQKLPAQS